MSQILPVLQGIGLSVMKEESLKQGKLSLMHRILSGPLSVENVTISIADLPSKLQGTKLVQMSDFHYDGLRLSEEMLEAAIEASNQQEPDLVLLTGDYITNDPEPIHQLVRRLKNLESRAGVYAVLGNHDLICSWAKQQVQDALTSIGIRVLWNEVVYPLGPELALVGLADYWSREFKPAPVMNQLPAKLPRIVLSHNPDSAQVLQQWRVDLQLSGHTHGGQIVIPGIGPVMPILKTIRASISSPVQRWLPFLRRESQTIVQNWEWFEGQHQVGKNQLYVNRGLGTYLPGRLFCPPEVTVITLNSPC